jgi:hypothetical protein
MMFNSRGFKDAAAKKGAELEASLLKASENGKWPIVCDTSPCLSQIKSSLSDPALRWVGGWALLLVGVGWSVDRSGGRWQAAWACVPAADLLQAPCTPLYAFRTQRSPTPTPTGS